MCAGCSTRRRMVLRSGEITVTFVNAGAAATVADFSGVTFTLLPSGASTLAVTLRCRSTVRYTNPAAPKIQRPKKQIARRLPHEFNIAQLDLRKILFDQLLFSKNTLS